jgi:hypothetical protein
MPDRGPRSGSMEDLLNHAMQGARVGADKGILVRLWEAGFPEAMTGERPGVDRLHWKARLLQWRFIEDAAPRFIGRARWPAGVLIPQRRMR